MRMLVAVDESENSQRAVEYVASLLGPIPNVSITLFHVLKPIPRELLEHGGSENPAAEALLGEELRREQDAWVEKETGIRVFRSEGAPRDAEALWV